MSKLSLLAGWAEDRTKTDFKAAAIKMHSKWASMVSIINKWVDSSSLVFTARCTGLRYQACHHLHLI